MSQQQQDTTTTSPANSGLVITPSTDATPSAQQPTDGAHPQQQPATTTTTTTTTTPTPTTDGTADTVNPDETFWKDVSAKSGIEYSKFETFSTTLAEGKDLAQEDLDALYKAFPKALVDQHISNYKAAIKYQEVEAQRVRQDLLSSVGGDEGFEKISTWAASAEAQAFITPQWLESYNKVVSSPNVDVSVVAEKLAYLKMQYDKANPTTAPVVADPRRQPAVVPTEHITGNPLAGGDIFQSKQDFKNAMLDPRYNKDVAYTQSVKEKHSRSLKYSPAYKKAMESIL